MIRDKLLAARFIENCRTMRGIYRLTRARETMAEEIDPKETGGREMGTPLRF
jgi:hypothetical protein